MRIVLNIQIRMGFGWAITFQRYGDWWRRHRRAMHEKFYPAAAEAYKPVQVKHTRYVIDSSIVTRYLSLGKFREVLRRLLTKPEDFTQHIRHAAGAIIMEVLTLII